ncbi:hsp70-binding protein 1-like [Asterias amurensis]|uniref:hsp70-binding protein 1-like n=1 Tax=Asterias amurensis TaxID=7602 RepID=UPI003AB42F3B
MASSGENKDGSSSSTQRRYPNSMEGVLQMAIANTPTEEAASGDSQRTEPTPLDPERKEFLEKVFAEMYKDEVKEMKSLLEVVRLKMDSELEEDEENVEEALENLKDLSDTIDNAQDFHKVGGTQLLPQLMDHPRSEVRSRTFDLIANLVQNVPLNQKVMLEMGGIEKMLAAVDKDSSPTVRVKALYALSCLARDHEDCQRVFVEKDGFSVLMRAMQSDVEKLQIKSAFMLQAFFQMPTDFKETLFKMGMVHQLIGLLQLEHSPTHEFFMSALLNLVMDHQGCINDCKQPDLGFKEFLTAREELLKGKPEYEEEHSYCQQLMKVCFNGNHGSQTTIDR